MRERHVREGFVCMHTAIDEREGDTGTFWLTIGHVAVI